jgi:streptogramin lyase
MAESRARASARIIAAVAVALVVSLWGALPVGAGDPVGQVTEFTAGLTLNSGPNRIAAGPDGNLWFTQNVGGIGRITPTGDITEFAIPSPNSGPVEIAAGPDANLWFTQNTDPGRIAKIGAGCVPPPEPPVPVTVAPRFTG